MREPRFASKPLNDLIQRLQRIQRRDEMTKEDADEVLTGAIVLNWQFFRHEGEEKTPTEIKECLWSRINSSMEKIAS